jgi:hypothetical protein
LGFDFIEFNLEGGLSPAEDNADPVGAMKKSRGRSTCPGTKVLSYAIEAIYE